MIEFSKAEALGNDYILLDLFKHREYELFVGKMNKLSPVLSNRNFGIGGDGVILIIPNDEYDCEMRIFNADGSEAEMCGNGIRQVARYFYENIQKKNVIKVLTKAGVKTVEVIDGEEFLFKVDMGTPIFNSVSIPINTSLLPRDKIIDEEFDFGFDKFKINLVSMGNPHCVIFTENLSDLNLEEIGPRIEKHPLFPNRTNVEFVRIVSNDEIAMRVWERGSGETMACGTGACASAAVAFTNKLVTSKKIKVHLLGGNLIVELGDDNNIYLVGGANIVFHGIFLKELAL
ncbi:MAG: diaminopimelate epimerase [Brevinematia bacterium]